MKLDEFLALGYKQLIYWTYTDVCMKYCVFSAFQVSVENKSTGDMGGIGTDDFLLTIRGFQSHSSHLWNTPSIQCFIHVSVRARIKPSDLTYTQLEEEWMDEQIER